MKSLFTFFVVALFAGSSFAQTHEGHNHPPADTQQSTLTQADHLQVAVQKHLAFADYYGHLLPLIAGGLCYALALPNYVAGPAFLVAMFVIIAFRVPPEERMLLEEFGDEYEAYRKRSYRLIPGLW